MRAEEVCTFLSISVNKPFGRDSNELRSGRRHGIVIKPQLGVGELGVRSPARDQTSGFPKYGEPIITQRVRNKGGRVTYSNFLIGVTVGSHSRKREVTRTPSRLAAGCSSQLLRGTNRNYRSDVIKASGSDDTVLEAVVCDATSTVIKEFRCFEGFSFKEVRHLGVLE